MDLFPKDVEGCKGEWEEGGGGGLLQTQIPRNLMSDAAIYRRGSKISAFNFRELDILDIR